jgi:hypothetical protein
MVQFFRKIHCKYAKCGSTQILGELTRDASSHRAKKRESGIAYASNRIQPFPLTALPTSYLCEQNFPSQGSPKKAGGGGQNNIIAEINNQYFYLQTSKCFK